MKRSAPLKRAPFRKEGPTAPRSERPRADAEPKKLKCRHCKKPVETGALHDECVDAWWAAFTAKRAAKLERERKAAQKAERKRTRERKAAIKTRPELKSAAQDAFNTFIRERDHDKPCVSCGVENPPMKPGGRWDAGHYKSRGAHPELAFDEDNCHKQCKGCNAGGGRFSEKERTVTEKYTEEVARRIGPERMALLCGPHPARKWTREELVELAVTYRRKARDLVKARTA